MKIDLRRSTRVKKKPKYFPPNDMRPAPSSKKIAKKKKAASNYFFPDGIVVEIISRLPAEDVVVCRRVCKRWKELTYGQDFLKLHKKRAVPMILVVDCSNRSNPLLLNKWWEPARKKSVVHRFSDAYRTEFSHGGLVVSSRYLSPDKSQDFNVFNPMNGESVRISLSEEICLSDMYGVFFHPSLKEYCTLWRIRKRFESMDMARQEVQYKMLNLGSDPQWREIRNPWTHRPRIFASPPVLIENYLYWLVEAAEDHKYNDERITSKTLSCHFQIMEFDIGKEEFALRPCPLPVVDKKYERNMRLLNTNGLLSLVQIFGSRKQIDVNIWTLKYPAKQFWSHYRYTTASEVHPKKEYLRVLMLRPIAVVNEELAFQSDRRIFVYNLRCGTIRKIGKKDYGSDAWFVTHSMTFASLRNCTSNICMDEDGMVDDERQEESRLH